MHSILSQPYTSILSVCWTLERIPRLLATHGLHLITDTATSAYDSCKPRIVRFRRHAEHFSPHTRPPDTHAQFSPHHTTSTHTLEVGSACLEYQGSLVNTNSSLVLRSIPNKQRNRHSRPAVPRPQDGLDSLGDNTLDEDGTRVSDDSACDTSMSSARGGFGGFGGTRCGRP
jgi:hypothetical protein